ncbi:hypothetical protein CASFOL_003516 [Castilleja foliolosa]|uniref:Uncharacterized protein n=1 Tax=Castilleja foliolosa TaxID=1961234 RepID=A0ABD3EHD9_9LAMI
MEYQNSGMLSREQLLHLVDRFAFLTSQPEVKKRIYDAVNDKQEAVAVTTAIQEEIFSEMGVEEEIACEEAELGPENFAERMAMQHYIEEQQLEMLKHMRNFQLDDQSAIIEKIHQQMENANFQPESSLLSIEQIQDNVRRRVSPVFQPI